MRRTTANKVKMKHRLEMCCVAIRNKYTKTETGNEENAVQDASDTLNKDLLAEMVEFDA